MDNYVDLVYRHARYDVTSYFQSTVVEVRRKAENAVLVALRFA